MVEIGPGKYQIPEVDQKGKSSVNQKTFSFSRQKKVSFIDDISKNYVENTQSYNPHLFEYKY